MVVDVRWRRRRLLILRLRRLLVHRFGVVGRPLEVVNFCPRTSELCPCRPKRMLVLVVGRVQEAVGVAPTLVVVVAFVAAAVAFVAAVAAAVAADAAVVADGAAVAADGVVAADAAVVAAFAAVCVEPVSVDDSSAVDAEFVIRCLWH